MTSQSISSRKQYDFTKLLMAGYDLNLVSGSTEEFLVTFHGPKNSPYEDGVWQVRVKLPAEYPFSSPSIGFIERIFHPNIDEISGTVCLNVINETWTPLYSLVNVFETFLPQLLMYPNPDDPLNNKAARLFLDSKTKYNKFTKDFVSKFASREAWEQKQKEKEENEVSPDSIISLQSKYNNKEEDLEALDIEDL